MRSHRPLIALVNCVSLGLRRLAKFACYSFGLPSNGCGVLTGLLLGILCLELVVLEPLGRDLRTEMASAIATLVMRIAA